jgi:ubiquinone/menaquinone biosynthesis C-methylase UbiE
MSILLWSYAWGYSAHAVKTDSYLPLNHLKRWQYAHVWDALAASKRDAFRAATGEPEEEKLRRSAQRTIAALLELVSISNQDDVMEIGCGVGRIGRELAPHCRTWTGVDISANMLAWASDRMHGVRNAGFALLRSDGLKRFGENAFDVIYATNMFGHLDEIDRWRYLEEVFHVLRPGGRIFVDNIDLESDAGWSIFVNDASRYQGRECPPYMPRFSTAAELTAYAKGAGFENLQSYHRSPLVILTAAKPLKVADSKLN